MNQLVVQELTRMAQGNPGAAKVLVELVKTEDDAFMTPFVIAYNMTQTKAPALWMVYKDHCNFDINETKRMLKTWYDSSTLPLERWLDERQG